MSRKNVEDGAKGEKCAKSYTLMSKSFVSGKAIFSPLPHIIKLDGRFYEKLTELVIFLYLNRFVFVQKDKNTFYFAGFLREIICKIYKEKGEMCQV